LTPACFQNEQRHADEHHRYQIRNEKCACMMDAR
jgi:hypothetical protein